MVVAVPGTMRPQRASKGTMRLVTMLLLVGCGSSAVLPGTSDAPPPGSPRAICSAGGWCWSNPVPQGNTLRDMWGAAPDDVWAVGVAGTILRWNGSSWNRRASGRTAPPLGVWGASAMDVWAVGAAGTILHWDGAAWSAVESGTTQALSRVWGASDQAVFAAGAGVILRWDGARW